MKREFKPGNKNVRENRYAEKMSEKKEKKIKPSDRYPVLKVKDKFLQLYKGGYPLIAEENLLLKSGYLEAIPDGSTVQLVSGEGDYVATGYLGRQNRGIGWVVSKNPKEELSEDFFYRKLYFALEKRQEMFKNPKTNAFRLFHGEGDGFGGVSIDFYDGTILIQYYSEGARHFGSYFKKAIGAMCEHEEIVEKCRFETDASDAVDASDAAETGEQAGTAETKEKIILENGMKFVVHPDDGAMTGIFLDQREVRRQIRNKYARGKSVLNLFSYSGGFTVAAALGGASSTMSVDIASRSHILLEKNLSYNGISRDDPNMAQRHRHLAMDVFEYLENGKELFDLIILDPPSFSSTNRGTFSVKRNYGELVQKARARLSRGGLLICSTNYSKMDMAHFKKMVENALGRGAKLVEEITQPQDFRYNPFYFESKYLKVLIYMV